jgi:hypothetical protein
MSVPQASVLANPEIDEIWRQAAARLGFRLARTEDAYATSDGRGVIAIGVEQALDHDDALGQLVFHELCHAITEGEKSVRLPDWGLENVDEDAQREHACLRVQAALADRFGLRASMAPTTPYRAYYERLAEDPLRPISDEADATDPAIAIAAAALARFELSAWRAAIDDALSSTARLLGARLEQRHRAGFALGPAGERCSGCAWMYVGGRGPAVARCRQSAPPNGDGVRVDPSDRACERWEPPVDCRTCGACCREAYHSVTVSMRDPVVWQEPDLVERHGHRFEIRREGPRCAALVLGRKEAGDAPYSCAIYEHRPRPCREFEGNGRHCLEARRRVGLSA